MAAATIVVAGLSFASPILVPVALAILISFAVAPLVSRLERWRFGRVGSVTTVMLLAVALAAGTVVFVAGQAADLATRLPEYRGNLSKKFEVVRNLDRKWVSATGELARAKREPDAAEKTDPAPVATPPAPGDLAPFRDMASRSLQFFVAAGGVLIMVVFILLQRHDLHARALRVAGGGRYGVTSKALDEAAEKVSRYLLAETALNALYGSVIAVGLHFIGIPNALIWGLLGALLRFVPYIGPIIAASLPISLSLAVSSDWSLPLATVGLFVAVELVVNNLIEPLVRGRSTGLSPVAILASAAFWAWLWGPVGLILSTPLTVCLFVVGKHYPPFHFFHVLLGQEFDRSLTAKLYPLLVSSDHDAVLEAVTAELKRTGLAEALDAMLVPALEMVKRNRLAGQLESEDARRMIRDIEEIAEEAAEEAMQGVETPVTSVGEVVCVPTKDAEDAACCLMLTRILARDGVTSRTCMFDAIATPAGDERHPAVFCVLDVRTSSPRRLQHLVRRLRARFPGVPVVAARLPANGTIDARPTPDALHSASTLEECREVVKRLLGSVRVPEAPVTTATV